MQSPLYMQFEKRKQEINAIVTGEASYQITFPTGVSENGYS